MFSEDFLKQQKQALLKNKQEIITALKERDAKLDKNVKNFEDYDVQSPHLSKDNEPLDLDVEAQEVAGFDARIDIENTLEEKLVNINAALKNLENGKYGVCSHCQKVISDSRLEALPEAQICVDCEKTAK